MVCIACLCSPYFPAEGLWVEASRNHWRRDRMSDVFRPCGREPGICPSLFRLSASASCPCGGGGITKPVSTSTVTSCMWKCPIRGSPAWPRREKSGQIGWPRARPGSCTEQKPGLPVQDQLAGAVGPSGLSTSISRVTCPLTLSQVWLHELSSPADTHDVSRQRPQRPVCT